MQDRTFSAEDLIRIFQYNLDSEEKDLVIEFFSQFFLEEDSDLPELPEFPEDPDQRDIFDIIIDTLLFFVDLANLVKDVMDFDFFTDPWQFIIDITALETHARSLTDDWNDVVKRPEYYFGQ